MPSARFASAEKRKHHKHAYRKAYHDRKHPHQQLFPLALALYKAYHGKDNADGGKYDNRIKQYLAQRKGQYGRNPSYSTHKKRVYRCAVPLRKVCRVFCKQCENKRQQERRNGIIQPFRQLFKKRFDCR